jgi:hypothetical protein
MLIDFTRQLSDDEFERLKDILTKVYELPEYPEWDEEGNLLNTEELTGDEKEFFDPIADRLADFKHKMNDLEDWYQVPGIYEPSMQLLKDLDHFTYMLLLDLRGDLDTVYVKGRQAYFYMLLKYYYRSLAIESLKHYICTLVEDFGWYSQIIQPHYPSNDEIMDWLPKHCVGAFITCPVAVYFKNKSDAVHFKLVWHNNPG